ncbi:MAG: penicillin-binding protein 2 [Ruminococcus sp.]|nr:penicillin-binding protein 2 [Ruminococcus sp.]
MIRKRAETGIITLGITFAVFFVVIIGKYSALAANPKYAESAAEQRAMVINVDGGSGNIYDRNMKLLVNTETKYIAVAVPQAIDAEEAAGYAADEKEFYEKLEQGVPFTFECTEEIEESEALTVFEVPERYSDNQIAQHVIGYTSQGEGVAGIEAAYNSILRDSSGRNSVMYSADGFGRVLIGDGKNVSRSGDVQDGVVLTLDSKIQRICEEAGKKINKGAIVVTEIKTGDILALASFPDYSVTELEEALQSEDSPMINRAFYSYSVGSIFKLVTACQAVEEGYDGYMYNCTGEIDVNGQIFRCHKLDGHGLQTMTDAMVNSCNTYFISLSRLLSVPDFRETAFSLGFGREIHLCSGMTASGGVLPTAEQLLIPAELANFSFGQGKLTATPLQISQLTCAVANNGKIPVLRLVKGLTEDGRKLQNDKEPQYSYAMDADVSAALKDMMTAAVYENDASNARPFYVTAGAKTSTAQTGRCDDDGNELCNAWITGFFPADDPEYAVTVLVEDGGYGNDSAAPVFRQIADKIARSESDFLE